MYSKDEYKDVILQSIYKNDLTFDDDYQKMEIIATLRMFLDKYDFEDFIKNYVISGLIKKNGVWKVKLASILSLFKKDYLQMSVKKQ